MKQGDINIYINYNGMAFKVATVGTVAKAQAFSKRELACRNGKKRRGCPATAVIQRVVEVLR